MSLMLSAVRPKTTPILHFPMRRLKACAWRDQNGRLACLTVVSDISRRVVARGIQRQLLGCCRDCKRDADCDSEPQRDLRNGSPIAARLARNDSGALFQKWRVNPRGCFVDGGGVDPEETH